MVEQEQNRIRGIEQCFATAGLMFDPVVNRVFAIWFKDGWICSSHGFSFLFVCFSSYGLPSDSDARATVSVFTWIPFARFFSTPAVWPQANPVRILF
jgi:hypothetical protein